MRQEDTSSCRRRVRESCQLRPGSRATSIDFISRTTMRARCVRPYTCIWIRSCPGRNHRSSAIKRATSAPGVSIGVFAARRRAYYARSPRAMNQEMIERLKEIIYKGHFEVIPRLLTFFLVFVETKINLSNRCRSQILR